MSALNDEVRKVAKLWGCSTEEARKRLLWLGLAQVTEPADLKATAIADDDLDGREIAVRQQLEQLESGSHERKQLEEEMLIIRAARQRAKPRTTALTQPRRPLPKVSSSGDW